MEKITDVILGVDLGKINDFTAIAGLVRIQNYKAWPYQDEPYGEARYRLMGLERFPLNTEWVEQVQFAKVIYDNVKQEYEEKKIKPDIIIDQGGVGGPMVDLFKRVIPNAKGCHFTSGHNVNYEDGVYYVPKQHLVTNLQIVIQSRRLEFARNIPDPESLKTELLNFSYKINSETGYVSFEHATASKKDDQVLAIAMAIWFGEKGIRRMLSSFKRSDFGL